MKRKLLLVAGCFFASLSSWGSEYLSCSAHSQSTFSVGKEQLQFQLKKNGHIFDIYGVIDSSAVFGADQARGLILRMGGQVSGLIADQAVSGVYYSFSSKGSVAGLMTVYEIKGRAGEFVSIIESNDSIVFSGSKSACK